VEQHQIKSASMLAGSLVLSPANVDANMALLSSAVDFKAARQALGDVLAETDAQPMPNAENLLTTLAATAAGDRRLLDWRSRLSKNSSWWFLVDQFFGSDPNVTAGYVRPMEKISSLAQKEQLRQWLAESADGVAYHLSGWSYTLQDLINGPNGRWSNSAPL
jgi:hypothetical protein